MLVLLLSIPLERRRNNSSPVIMATGFCRSWLMSMLVFILFLFVDNTVVETQLISVDIDFACKDRKGVSVYWSVYIYLKQTNHYATAVNQKESG